MGPPIKRHLQFSFDYPKR
uniref:Uncharacterized protein n=1 Tax=Anguilla anguilla TaxID=7936 RepID=A0A0E9TTS3_ANGAN